MVSRTNRMMFALAVAAIMVMISLPSSHSQSNAGFAPQLPVSPANWISAATLGVLVVGAVAALVYMLSGLIGSTNARTWSRMQVYEALVSIILIIAFGFFSYLFFLNPQNAFSSLNLVPPTCTSASDIFTLATCDLATFNAASFTLGGIMFAASYISGFIPSIGVSITPVPTQQGLNASFVAPINPVSASTSTLFRDGFDAFLFMMVLNQIQLLILSGSLLFLSLFLVLGLIVRTFGVTRSFGGVMIAFGLGLGLVYPLLVSITYGFIVTNSGLACLAPQVGAQGVGQAASQATQVITGCVLNGVSISANDIISSVFSFATGGFGGAVGSFILTIGYIIAGFTFIPFLNFTVLNAFIVDFSKAIGEQVDFMSLLGQFI